MSPTDALTLLDQVAARFQGSREDHLQLQVAIDTLKKILEEYENLKNKNDSRDIFRPILV